MSSIAATGAAPLRPTGRPGPRFGRSTPRRIRGRGRVVPASGLLSQPVGKESPMTRRVALLAVLAIGCGNSTAVTRPGPAAIIHLRGQGDALALESAPEAGTYTAQYP